jgi:hypothetical protein
MCLFKTKILLNTRLKCIISKVHENHAVTYGRLCLLNWVFIKCIPSFSTQNILQIKWLLQMSGQNRNVNQQEIKIKRKIFRTKNNLALIKNVK